MCVVSAVTDYYTHTNPSIWPSTPDPETVRLLRQAIEILDRIDKKLGDRDCKNEIKAEFLKKLEEL